MGRGSAVALATVIGAVVGAIARPAVVYFVSLQNADYELSNAIAFISVTLGFVTGVISVLIASVARSPGISAIIGAAVGGLIAYVFTALTFLPLFFSGLLGVSDLEFNADPAIYGIAMGAAGALSGAIGGLLQALLSPTPLPPDRD